MLCLGPTVYHHVVCVVSNIIIVLSVVPINITIVCKSTIFNMSSAVSNIISVMFVVLLYYCVVFSLLCYQYVVDSLHYHQQYPLIYYLPYGEMMSVPTKYILPGSWCRYQDQLSLKPPLWRYQDHLSAATLALVSRSIFLQIPWC